MTDIEAYERGWKAAIEAATKAPDIRALADVITMPQRDFIDLTGHDTVRADQQQIMAINNRLRETLLEIRALIDRAVT